MGKARESALEERVNRLNAVLSEQTELIASLRSDNADLQELVIDCFNVIEVPAAYFGGQWHYAPWYQDLRDKAAKLGIRIDK